MSPNPHYQSEELIRLLKSKYMSQNEMTQLIYRYQHCKNPSKKEDIREHIFNNNIRFIRKTAAAHSRRSGIDIDDLFNSGVIGFLEGLEKFNIERGVHFTTYIKFWIDKSIYNQLYSQNILHIPKNHFQFKREQAERGLNSRLLFLDAPMSASNPESSFSWAEVIEDKNAIDAESNYVSKKEMDTFLKIMDDSLTTRERSVIRGYFLEGKTGKQIGKIIGTGGSNANVIAHQAIHKLKKVFKDKLQDGQYIFDKSNFNGDK